MKAVDLFHSNMFLPLFFPFGAKMDVLYTVCEYGIRLYLRDEKLYRVRDEKML